MEHTENPRVKAAVCDVAGAVWKGNVFGNLYSKLKYKLVLVSLLQVINVSLTDALSAVQIYYRLLDQSLLGGPRLEDLYTNIPPNLLEAFSLTKSTRNKFSVGQTTAKRCRLDTRHCYKILQVSMRISYNVEFNQVLVNKEGF